MALEARQTGMNIGEGERFRRGERISRYTVDIQPVNPDDAAQMVMLNEWFHDRRVIDHLVGIPNQPEALADYYKTPGVHGFLGVDRTTGEPIAVGTIREPGDPDSFARTTSGLVERVCVRPDLIRRGGIGTKFALLIIDKGFSSREEDGLDLAKLGLGVIEGPKNWQHAVELWRKVGFWDIGTRIREVVIEREGKKAPQRFDVRLMETSRDHFLTYIKPVLGLPRPSILTDSSSID